MILFIIWYFIIFIYLLIGNLIIRFFNERQILHIDDDDEFIIFALSIIFPVVFLYIVVKEVSIFIYNHLFN